MSIFPDPTPTPEEVAKEQVVELNTMANRIVELNKSFIEKMMNQFWNNSKSTPQEMSDIYGPLAYQLFVKLDILEKAIKAVDDSYEIPTVPEKYSYTINPDGTVTIVENEEESSSEDEEESSESSSSE